MLSVNPKPRTFIKARRAAKGNEFYVEQPVDVGRVNALLQRLEKDEYDAVIIRKVLEHSYFPVSVDEQRFNHKVSYMADPNDLTRLEHGCTLKGRYNANPKTPCLADLSPGPRGLLFKGLLRDFRISDARETIRKSHGVYSVLRHTLPELDAWSRKFAADNDAFQEDVFMDALVEDTERKLVDCARKHLFKLKIECCAYTGDGLMTSFDGVPSADDEAGMALFLNGISDACFAMWGVRVQWIESIVEEPEDWEDEWEEEPEEQGSETLNGGVEWRIERGIEDMYRYVGDEDYDSLDGCAGYYKAAWRKHSKIVEYDESYVREIDYTLPLYGCHKPRNEGSLLVHGIQAKMGGRKTTQVIDATKAGKLGRTLLVLSKKTLTVALKGQLAEQGYHYLDDKDTKLLNHDYVTTFQSLLKLRDMYADSVEKFPFETIIIDEARTMCATVSCTDTNKGYCLMARQEFLKLLIMEPTTQRLILLDADLMVDDSILYFIERFARDRENPSARKTRVIVEKYNGVSLDRTILDMGQKEFCDSLTADISQAVATNDTVVIACRLKTHAVYWEKVAMSLGATVRMYVSDPDEDENAGDLKDWVRLDKLLNKYKGRFAHVIIYTTRCSVGLSCDYPVLRVYADYMGRNGPDGREGAQMVARFRKPKDTTIRVCHSRGADREKFVPVTECTEWSVAQRQGIMYELELHCTGTMVGATLRDCGLFAPDNSSRISISVARERKTAFKAYFFHICHGQGYKILRMERPENIEEERGEREFIRLLNIDIHDNKQRVKEVGIARRAKVFKQEVKPMWDNSLKNKRKFREATGEYRNSLRETSEPSADQLAKLSVLNTVGKYAREGRDLEILEGERGLQVAKEEHKKIRNMCYFQGFDLERCRDEWLCKTRAKKKNNMKRNMSDPELVDNKNEDLFLDLEYQSMNADLFPICAGLHAICDEMKIDPMAILNPDVEVVLPDEYFEPSHNVAKCIVSNLSKRVKTKSTEPVTLLRKAVSSAFGTSLKKNRKMEDKQVKNWYTFEPDREVFDLSQKSVYFVETVKEVTTTTVKETVVRVTTRRIEERRAAEGKAAT